MNQKLRRSLKNVIRRSSSNIWLFPTLLLLLLIILSLLRISGTSIGIYNNYLYGDRQDSSLIYGSPQSIRSDEWLVTTQLTIAQSENNFERINKNLSGGDDTSLLADLPYREWSILFKPQNIAFLIMPLENALAFKWWLLLFALMISAYLFCLRLLPGKVPLAISFSIVIACSPFVFWWYQTATIATLTYGFLILLVGISIIDKSKIKWRNNQFGDLWSVTVKTILLSYLLVAFGLILYPPFQIPVAIIVAFFLLGYLIQHKPKKYTALILTCLPFVTAFVIMLLIVVTFVFTRASAVETISNTAYPGHRTVASGGYDIKRLLVVYLQPLLQYDSKGSKYITNQSESSSFILMPLFFILPAVVLLAWLYVRQKRIDWILLSIILCNLLFLANLFVPQFDTISKLFFLHVVPHDRLLIGLGFLAILLVAYLIKVIESAQVKFSRNVSILLGVYCAVFLGVILLTGLETARVYPEFVSSKKIILLLSTTLIIGYALIVLNKPRAGMAIIVLLSLASIARIHPLYQGLGPLYKSEVSKTIQDLSTKDDTWGAAHEIYIENLPQISNRKALTGVATYPDTRFWQEYSTSEQEIVYNRYAHSILSTDGHELLMLLAPDLYVISASCTLDINRELDYIISTTPLSDSCHTLIKTLPYPAKTFYFYKTSAHSLAE